MTYTQTSRFALGVVILGLIGLAIFLWRVFNAAPMDHTQILKVIASPVTHTKVDGMDVATKQVIVTSALRLARIKTDSAEILTLKALVRHLSKKAGAAAAVIITRTHIDTVTSVVHDSTPCSFHQSIVNRWIDAGINYNGRDSARLRLSVNNEFGVSFTERHDSSLVLVQSFNPYTRTQGVSAFQVPEKKRPKGLFWIGLGAGILGGYFIHR